MASAASSKQATVYRMVTPAHTCPYGLKTVDLLKRKGYAVNDNLIRSRAEQDAFKAEHDVRTTPQTFIGGERIGGWDDLRRWLGQDVPDKNAVSYRPVLAVFGVALLMALAASWAVFGTVLSLRTAEWFISFSMCILAMLKLQDVESFSSMFLGYDALARRYVPYAYAYPWLELLAGLLMTAGALMWLSVPVSLFIGGVGAASVFKAVYIDKRDIKCACVGGASKVPLGFVSLTENLMMVAMAVWMIFRPM